jgi:hypothetical protein
MSFQTRKYPLTDFERDKRLEQICNEGFLSVKCTRLFTILHNNYQVPIRIDASDYEMQYRDLVVFSRGKTLRAEMDAIAFLWNATWELTKKKEYLFAIDSLWEGGIYNHSNNTKADFAEAFINDSDNLSERLHNKLFSKENANLPPDKAGLSADQLPDIMYKQLLGIANIDHQTATSKLPEGHIVQKPASVPKSQIRVWLSQNPKKGYNTYNIKLFGGSFSSSMTVSDVKKKQKEYNNSKINEKYLPIYRTERNQISQKDKVRVPELKQSVEIHMQRAYLPDILKHLAERYNIPLVGNNRINLPQKCNVDIPKMPLYQVLDELTKLYSDTEWEWREMGMLVVRKKRPF